MTEATATLRRFIAQHERVPLDRPQPHGGIGRDDCKYGRPTCDCCGAAHPSVRTIMRDEVRLTVAPWIEKLCTACQRRLAPRPEKGDACSTTT